LLKCNFFADRVLIHRAGKTQEVAKNERISLREKNPMASTNEGIQKKMMRLKNHS
jgi:hypothetical protein